MSLLNSVGYILIVGNLMIGSVEIVRNHVVVREDLMVPSGEVARLAHCKCTSFFTSAQTLRETLIQVAVPLSSENAC